MLPGMLNDFPSAFSRYAFAVAVSIVASAYQIDKFV
jgi:hypothetical protein